MSCDINVKFGTDLILMIDTSAANDGTEYKAVAHATSHSVEYSRAIREISSKSTGDTTGKAYGKANWTASVDALISYSTSVCNYDTLMDYIKEKRKVKLIVLSEATTSNLADATGATEAGAKSQGEANSSYYQGEALISSVSQSAGDGENASFSISFEGCEDLTKTAIDTTYLVTVTVDDGVVTYYGEWIYVVELGLKVACNASGVATFYAADGTYNVIGSNDTEDLVGRATDVVVSGAAVPGATITIA